MQVTGSSYTHKFTIVPQHFFRPENARNILSEVVEFEENDVVSYVEIPSFSSVLVYIASDEGLLPEVYFLFQKLQFINEHNKIIASYAEGRLFLLISEYDNLKLCNSFEAPDFTTAQYFIFYALKRFQMNPEMSRIYFRTVLSEKEKMSLYRYFKSVEQA